MTLRTKSTISYPSQNAPLSNSMTASKTATRSTISRMNPSTPEPSLSAAAKAITGSHTSGFLFFSLNGKGRSQMKKRTNQKDPAVIRCAIYTRKSTEEGLDQGIQQPRRPARICRGLDRQLTE